MSRPEVSDVSGLRAIDLIDPRGRADRKGLIFTAAVLLGAQAGVAGTIYLTKFTLTGVASVVMESVLLWLGFVAVSKRLHDLGYGLKWLGIGFIAIVVFSVATAFGVIFAFGEDALLPGGAGYFAVAVSVFAPVVAATVWLHCAPGEKTRNRFGPVTDATGFASPLPRLGARAQRSPQATVAFN